MANITGKSAQHARRRRRRRTNWPVPGRCAERPDPVSGGSRRRCRHLNLDEDIARIRALREGQPFGAFDQKMTLKPIEGYKLHWFNDKPGRIETALRAGWTHIIDPRDGKPGC